MIKTITTKIATNNYQKKPPQKHPEYDQTIYSCTDVSNDFLAFYKLFVLWQRDR